MDMNIPAILLPLPKNGFDPTEAAIPWRYLIDEQYQVIVATPDGKPAQCDQRLLTGKNLGLFKSFLMTDKRGQKAYAQFEKSKAFQHPISYHDIKSKDYSALLIPGGHDKPIRNFLESSILQETVVEFFDLNKPVAAICHGTLLVGRSISKRTGLSVLSGRKTTGLTRIQELAAYYLTCLHLGDYYRTYPEKDKGKQKVTTEDELKTYLKNPTDFYPGPYPLLARRDNPSQLSLGFTVRDGNYLSARWPGDAHRFAAEFVKMIKENRNSHCYAHYQII